MENPVAPVAPVALRENPVAPVALRENPVAFIKARLSTTSRAINRIPMKPGFT
jgi:hypothetical protein